MRWQSFSWLVILALSIVVGLVGGWYLLGGPLARPKTDPGELVSEPKSDRVADRVVLSAAKLQAAQIRTQQVALQQVPDLRVLPGRLQYDDRRHAKVRAAAAGVMVAISVKPGDRVSEGQSLAVISSPELGEARADVLKRQAEWDIALRKQKWESQIQSNLQPFVTAIQQRQDVSKLQEQFRSTTLGGYREQLVSAYTRFVLADSLLKGANSVSAPGILAAKTIQERTTERQAAEAALLATCEQATFDAEQRRDLAELNAKDAQRRSEISRQHLRTLLGYDPAGDKPETGVKQDLSEVDVRAPFAGTIEQRNFSVSERVQASDELFVLADTTTLWIVSEAREQDWPAIAVQQRESISVHVPAIPDRQFAASVHFVGREVSATTNALSIVAEIDNRDGALRPGLFAQATVAVGPASPVLAVPSAAVVVHDQRSFVFVQESGSTFRRVDVETGRQTDDWIEIRSGLSAGDPVVVHGAFILKSELLLESEE